jgi:hypothetical protein
MVKVQENIMHIMQIWNIVYIVEFLVMDLVVYFLQIQRKLTSMVMVLEDAYGAEPNLLEMAVHLIQMEKAMNFNNYNRIKC